MSTEQCDSHWTLTLLTTTATAENYEEYFIVVEVKDCPDHIQLCGYLTDVCRVNKILPLTSGFIFILFKLSLKVSVVQTSTVFVLVSFYPDVMEGFIERLQTPSRRTIMLLRSKQNIFLMFFLLLDFSRNPKIIVEVSLLLFFLCSTFTNSIILKQVEEKGQFCKNKNRKKHVSAIKILNMCDISNDFCFK